MDSMTVGPGGGAAANRRPGHIVLSLFPPGGSDECAAPTATCSLEVDINNCPSATTYWRSEAKRSDGPTHLNAADNQIEDEMHSLAAFLDPPTQMTPQEDAKLLTCVNWELMQHSHLVEAAQDRVCEAARDQIILGMSKRLALYEPMGHTGGPARSSVAQAASVEERPVAAAVIRNTIAPEKAQFSGGLTDVNCDATPSAPGSRRDVVCGRMASSIRPVCFPSPKEVGGSLGVLRTLGYSSSGNRSNPMDCGQVVAFASSIRQGTLSGIIGGQFTNFRTANEENSYIGVDLSHGRELVLTGYSLTNRTISSLGLMSWVLEASIDGTSWEIVDEQSGCQRLRLAGATTFFKVTTPCSTGGSRVHLQSTRRGFRIFRLTQRGKNSSGSDVLAISHIELYGIAVAGDWPGSVI
eukprot:GHVT01068351.1.p1 GENE.GHVT01068351.1~~GHVT01068351.1.p1  ORF type:complete len:410 (+),score=30.72 GHVT01068351.1:1243-2472(+)